MSEKPNILVIMTDPWELENVVDDVSNRGALAEMQLRLADWSIRTEDARPVPMPKPGERM